MTELNGSAGKANDGSLMRDMLRLLSSDEAGVTAIEYGLIVLLVGLVCIVAWQLLGTNLSTAFSSFAASV